MPLRPPNNAAFLTGHTIKPLSITSTEDRYPNENELVIRTRAVAINQIDWKMQFTPWTTFNYPLILGVDVAGEVVHVGSEVGDKGTFAIGDRVLGHALRLATEDDRHAGFQEYAVLWDNMAARIPESVGVEQAAVLPLGVSTAAAGLFQEKTLNLGLPRLSPVSQGSRTVLVWGGTSSVGGNAIQLAVAAGYDVIATASKRNFDTVKRLGAIIVIDYSSATVVEDLKKAFSGRKLAGAFDAIGKEESLKPVLEAVSQMDGVKKVVSTTDWVNDDLVPPGIEATAIMAIDIRGEDGEDRDETVGKKVYGNFLYKALEAGKYQIYPEPWVVGAGLGSIQDALDRASKDPKGKKVVVTI
ncbi:chaperonin 10-like protein [Aspergillus californicus]